MVAVAKLGYGVLCPFGEEAHVPSPDGTHVADVSVDNCLVLTTSVGVRRSTDPFRWGREEWVLSARKADPIDLRWQDNTTLVLIYKRNVDYVYDKRTRALGSVRVIFQ